MRLTPRQRWVLRTLATHECDAECADGDGYCQDEILVDGNIAYIGLTRISIGTVNALLGYCLLREDALGDSCRRYTINSTGHDALRDEAGTLAAITTLMSAHRAS